MSKFVTQSDQEVTVTARVGETATLHLKGARMTAAILMMASNFLRAGCPVQLIGHGFWAPNEDRGDERRGIEEQFGALACGTEEFSVTARGPQAGTKGHHYGSFVVTRRGGSSHEREMD